MHSKRDFQGLSKIITVFSMGIALWDREKLKKESQRFWSDYKRWRRRRIERWVWLSGLAPSPRMNFCFSTDFLLSRIDSIFNYIQIYVLVVVVHGPLLPRLADPFTSHSQRRSHIV